MCGRFTLTRELREVAERFGVHSPRGFAGTGVVDHPRYNIAPTQDVIVIADDGSRSLKQMRWGLIPSWAKDPAIGSRMINARSESLTEKVSYRTALTKRRCLIPADGFYEWQKLGKIKQPLRIVLKSRELFGLAGLWDSWTSPDGIAIQSCTIITTAANALLKAVHDRMPAILSRDAEPVWLDPETKEPSVLLPLLQPYPPDEMEYYPVSRTMNSPTHDTADCVERVG